MSEKIVCVCGLIHNGEPVIVNTMGIEVLCPCCKRIWKVREEISKVITDDKCSECWEHYRVMRGDEGLEAFEELFVKALRARFNF